MDGGATAVAATDLLYVLNGRITTSVQLGRGNGGDIRVGEPAFVVLNHGDIIAQAYEGTGGNIRITADRFISSPDSVVDASSQLGIDGTVQIDSPDVDVSSGLAMLPANFLDATRWMRTPCEARTGEDVSRLVIRNRDGLPPCADGVLPGPPPGFD